jgi:adenine deaminase
MSASFTIEANLIDIFNESIYPARITVEGGRIRNVVKTKGNYANHILPGFVDSHVHIESSMLVPSEFARLAVIHGTISTVSDPHEIANVMGMEGVEFMIENGNTVPFYFNFGAPSCVPATTFETAGAVLDAAAVEQLLMRPEIKYLSEMMNFPGVLHRDKEVMEKIAAAHRLGKPVDGHAPGLRGEQAAAYIQAGISTDHECFTSGEAQDKLKLGMKILIREGSAAKNFEALIDLLKDHPDQMMFCSDDKHPDDLVEGHINQLVKRAIAKKIPLFSVLKAAILNPVKHYGLEMGLLRERDAADFILIDNTQNWNVLQTWIGGQLVAEKGVSFIGSVECTPVNNFNVNPKVPDDFKVYAETDNIRVIQALDGQLITRELHEKLAEKSCYTNGSSERDILKITVVNRYSDKPPAMAFISGTGLKRGAIASCVAHDSHNIIAVGVNDEEICNAVNQVIGSRGGIAAVDGDDRRVLPLPVAGIMSPDDAYKVSAGYAEISAFAKELGSPLHAPFMTLSFMALLVIPDLKLSDMGLFSGNEFKFVPIFE